MAGGDEDDLDLEKLHSGSSSGGYGTGGSTRDRRDVGAPDDEEPDPDRVFPKERFGGSAPRPPDPGGDGGPQPT